MSESSEANGVYRSQLLMCRSTEHKNNACHQWRSKGERGMAETKGRRYGYFKWGGGIIFLRTTNAKLLSKTKGNAISVYFKIHSFCNGCLLWLVAPGVRNLAAPLRVTVGQWFLSNGAPGFYGAQCGHPVITEDTSLWSSGMAFMWGIVKLQTLSPPPSPLFSMISLNTDIRIGWWVTAFPLVERGSRVLKLPRWI